MKSKQYNGTIYGVNKDKNGYLDYNDIVGSYGYITRGAVVQNFSIVKSECVMFNKKDVRLINYLDEQFDYYDAIADLSFSLFNKYNKLNVVNPHIEIKVLDIYTDIKNDRFFNKWKKELEIPDPNYNINLKFEANKLFEIK